MSQLFTRSLSGAFLACTLIAGAGLAVGTGAPALAAAAAPFYHAELAAPLDAPRREILNGVVWHCDGADCYGSRSGSRPQIVCGQLAEKLGPIASFESARGALDEQDLARCNKD